MRLKNCPVLVVGDSKMLPDIVICLLEAGHPVWFWDNEETGLVRKLDFHFSAKSNKQEQVLLSENFQAVADIGELDEVGLAIAVTSESLVQKKNIVSVLEKVVSNQSLILVNLESIPLNKIQENTTNRERVLGLNWTEPANTTFFLEVVSNNHNREKDINDLVNLARSRWNKDPYVLKHGMGIRSRMLAALVREAFYLVENGYVSVEDIDRACRNDAGYYLPFAGNCRYMDLMGTYLYGIVMKDLNPELSKSAHIPAFFKDIIERGGKGMENGKGIYTYSDGEVEEIRESFSKFSYLIRDIMSRYPFEIEKKKDRSPVGSKTEL